MSDTEKDWSVWVEILFEDKKRAFTGTEAECRTFRDDEARKLDNIDELFLCRGEQVVEHTNGTKPYKPQPSQPTEPEPLDMAQMNIRDAHKPDAPVTSYDPEAGIAILSTDGLPLWRVRLAPDGSLIVKCGTASENDGKTLSDSIQISPIASNYILLTRPALVFPASSK